MYVIGHMRGYIYMGYSTCVENEKKAVFSLYPGLAIYTGQVMWRKELKKKRTVTHYCHYCQ